MGAVVEKVVELQQGGVTGAWPPCHNIHDICDGEARDVQGP